MDAHPKDRAAGEKKAVDWDDLYHRLAASRQSINREMTPAERKEILKARAKALAGESVEGETAAECLELLEFRLAYETYGIEMRHIQETAPLKELTPLPGTPAFVLGLINLRGRILSVIDIKKFFDLPEKGLTDLNKIIVLQREGMEFGLLADEILGVRLISRGEIYPSLPTLTGVREEYLMGVTRERTVLLDGQKLLNDENLVVNDEE
jgi:purine-binding chemotaxis protein CheW